MDDNNLECPSCGEVFSMEFTRCPRCGLNMYPGDDEQDLDEISQEDASQTSSGVAEALLAVVLGLILAGAVSFLIHMFASRGMTAQGLPVGWTVALFVAGPLAAAIGGYSMSLVGQRSRSSAAGLGALVGVGCAALVVLFETRWRLVTAQVLLEPAMLVQYGLCLLGGALGGWLSGKTEAAFWAGGARPAHKEVKGMSWEDLMYRDLLTRVRFNRATAERLIEFERRLAPDAERFTLISNAIDRLDRDRRS